MIRRATFDLTGLPPTPEEIAAFEADTTPGAYDRLIDRLLASPRYGERWGRYWLDVARYADTKGYVLFQDADFHWAYTYRDYVIDAFNRDLPYDRFLVEQIAADRLPPGTRQETAGGARVPHPGGRFMGNVHDVIDDRIDVVCRGLMSLTVTCARCHDHKFDPIPTEDYYSLYGVLASAREPAIPPEADETAAHRGLCAFVKELEARQQKLSEFVAAKHREMVERGEAPRGGVSPGRAAGARPADHRRFHADRRRQRLEPDDAGALAGLPVADPQRARPGLCTLARAGGLAEREFATVPPSLDRPARGWFRSTRRSDCVTSQSGRRPGPGRTAASIAGRGRSDLRSTAERRRADLARQGRPRDARWANARASARAGAGIAAPGVPRSGQSPQRRHTPLRRPGTFARPSLASQAPRAAKRRAKLADHWSRRSTAGPEPGGYAHAGRAASLSARKSQQPGRTRAAAVPRRSCPAPSGSRFATAEAGSSWRGQSPPGTTR